MKLCEHPPPGIALVVREFHSNLRLRVGSIVYVQSKWVDLSMTKINQIYNLVDDKAYRALFQNTDYQQLMRSFTWGQGVWTCHPSTLEMTTFKMKTLKPIVKVWYNFLCAKLKPNLHLTMVTKDKTILLYAIVQGIKFDVGLL